VRAADAMPPALRTGLVELLGDEVDDVEIVERSWYARLHLGARATTRRNRILLRGTAAEFFADPELVLHEYFHVLRQWNRGRLSIAWYVAEWLRRGYWRNRYEHQARRYTRLRLPALLARLQPTAGDGPGAPMPVECTPRSGAA
jgi:hypothetical protein